MGEWMPIESAPKTRIIGRRTSVDRYTGRLRYEKHESFWGRYPVWPQNGWYYGRAGKHPRLWEPTQWQPLLSPLLPTRQDANNE